MTVANPKFFLYGNVCLPLGNTRFYRKQLPYSLLSILLLGPERSATVTSQLSYLSVGIGQWAEHLVGGMTRMIAWILCAHFRSAYVSSLLVRNEPKCSLSSLLCRIFFDRFFAFICAPLRTKFGTDVGNTKPQINEARFSNCSFGLRTGVKKLPRAESRTYQLQHWISDKKLFRGLVILRTLINISHVRHYRWPSILTFMWSSYDHDEPNWPTSCQLFLYLY